MVRWPTASTTASGSTIAVIPREAGKERVELRVGGACPGHPEDVVVVRTAPTRVAACTGHTLAEALAAAGTDLVDPSPFFAHADEMEELRIETVGRDAPRVEIVRRGTGWSERAPEERELTSDETDSANALAVALAGARGTDVHRAAADERFEPHARVTIARTGGGTREVVELGPAGPDGSALGAARGRRRAPPRDAGGGPAAGSPPGGAARSRVWRAPFDPGAVVAVDDTCGPTPQRLELRRSPLAPSGSGRAAGGRGHGGGPRRNGLAREGRRVAERGRRRRLRVRRARCLLGHDDARRRAAGLRRLRRGGRGRLLRAHRRRSGGVRRVERAA